MSDIVKRLRKVESGRAVRGEWAINWFRNPDGPEAAAEIERLTRRLEGATRLLNAWHFEYHHGRRLEGIDDDTTTWLGGIDLPGSAADQPEPQSPTQEGEK